MQSSHILIHISYFDVDWLLMADPSTDPPTTPNNVPRSPKNSWRVQRICWGLLLYARLLQCAWTMLSKRAQYLLLQTSYRQKTMEWTNGESVMADRGFNISSDLKKKGEERCSVVDSRVQRKGPTSDLFTGSTAFRVYIQSKDTCRAHYSTNYDILISWTSNSIKHDGLNWTNIYCVLILDKLSTTNNKKIQLVIYISIASCVWKLSLLST